MAKHQRHGAEVKLAVVERVVKDGAHPEGVCRDLGVARSLYYRWLEQFVEHAAARVSGRAPPRASLETRIAELRDALNETDTRIEAELRVLTRRRLAHWGRLHRRWVPAEVRDEVVAFVTSWSRRGAARTTQMLDWLGLSGAKFYDWRRRLGQPNRRRAPRPAQSRVPQDVQRRVIDYARANPALGYRRIARELRREHGLQLSDSSVYRILLGGRD
jgi:transposase-like protein